MYLKALRFMSSTGFKIEFKIKFRKYSTQSDIERIILTTNAKITLLLFFLFKIRTKAIFFYILLLNLDPGMLSILEGHYVAFCSLQKKVFFKKGTFSHS